VKEDPRWWLASEEDRPHEKIMRVVKALDQALDPIKERMARAARLYDPTVEVSGSVMDNLGAVGPYPLPGESRGPVTMNVVKSAIDTVTSMIAKNQPVPSFVTDGANYSMALRAKDLERFMEAEFARIGIYEKAVRMFLFGTCAGLGPLKIYEADGKAEADAVAPWDLVWDPAECMAGPPRQLHHLRFVDRDVLKSLFPDEADFIDAASADDKIRQWTDYRSIDSELLAVVESWHLASGPDETDGVHAVCIEGHTLLWEKWEDPCFPFVFFRWAERLAGFDGCSLSEELAGIQNKINKINWHITRSHDTSNSYVLVQLADAGLRIKAAGGGDPLRLLAYRGSAPPQFITPPAVAPELYQHLIYLVQQAYRIAGISELNATAQVPAQFESSVALNTYNDINTQRFSIQAQQYERKLLEVARLIMRLMKRISDDKVEARWRTGNVAKTIRWGDVKLDEDMYVMSIKASSITSRTPSGKIDAAVNLANAGLLDKAELRRIIDHPDLQRPLDLENSSIDHAEAIIERLSRGEYVPPERYDNLQVAIKYVANAFMMMKDAGAPDNVLDGFRLWLKTAVAKASPGMPGMPGMAPGGAPGPAGPQVPQMPGPGGMPGGMPMIKS
jgi:hypothetical protein